MRLGDRLWPGLADSRHLVVLPFGSCEQHGRFVAWAHSPDASAARPKETFVWNFITISVANLVLIAVMVVIFGAALLLPFPGRRRPDLPPEDAAGPEEIPGYEAAQGDERMWTARVRRWGLIAAS